MSIDWKAFLSSQGARFDSKQRVTFGTEPESRHSNTLAVLTNKTFISIEGSDAAKFLQGQISVHMNELLENKHRPGVACTPKGRMYSSFRILHQPSGYRLVTEQNVAEHTLATLNKYAVFFKSELARDDSLMILALSGNNIESIFIELGIILAESDTAIKVEGGYLLKVPGLCPRFELWIDKQSLPFWWEKLTKNCIPVSEGLQRLLDIEAVIPGINSACIEKYIPQQLNMATLGAVSFRKGCYTGQEIVTRMQSLGQQKNRTYRLLMDQNKVFEPATKLFDLNGKNIGEVIDSSFAPDTAQTEALAVIRIDAADTGHVYLDEHQTQILHVQPLPYLIDTKQELQQ